MTLLRENNQNLGSKQIVVLGDSGSSWSLISHHYKHYAIDIRPIPPDIVLVAATGTKIMGQGIGLFLIKIGETIVTTDFFIVDGEWPYTIVGLSLLEKLNTVIDLASKTLVYLPVRWAKNKALK